MTATWKTIRVFISSTFTDMKEERRILQKDVFPRLEKYCEENGAKFQAVDLRWGVNEESQLNQKTLEICLNEIVRCQRLSPKPNFIMLLGDRYGWQPVPAKIPSSEMALIQKQLNPVENDLIETWYREDLNAVSPEYVLQPREGAFQPYAAWQPIEIELLNILRKAVVQLPFIEEQKIKYFTSATHQEIIQGAMNPPHGAIDPEEHVFAYLRIIRALPEDRTAKDYIDLSGDDRDAYSKTQLGKLKQDLKIKLPRDHIHEYGANWINGCILDDTEAFGDRVYSDLKSVIESQLQETEIIDPLAREIKHHEVFKNERLKHFTGRKDALFAIADYLNSSADKVFTIIGASGTGKTALMAKAIEEAYPLQGVKVYRFLGTTTATSDAFQFLSGLVREIASAYTLEMNAILKKGEDETKFSTLRGLQEILPRCLNLATKEKPLVIFLDALDQLSRDFMTLSLDWLPKDLPAQVKIVVSALPELKDKLSHMLTYELGAMPAADGEELLKKWLDSVKRTLQDHQGREIMDKFAANGTPLYLKLAFEKAKEWHSYSMDISLNSAIDGVLDEYFDGLEKNHGNFLVQKVCGYLLAGKYQGLMEQEILDLLAFDEEHWQYFLEHTHPDHREEVQKLGKLPIVVWSRLFLDLEPYLTEREADGLPLISFYHRKFLDYVRLSYLSEPLLYHCVLAKYFEESSLYLDEKEERPNTRKVVEQPYQHTFAEQWENVKDKSLANFPFLMAKTKASMVDGILEDYAFLWDRAPETVKDQLDLWRAFFTERAHILRRGNPEWPSFKILLQLAIEHANDSPVTIGAEKWLAEGRCDWTWLRRNRRLPHAQISLCRAVLEGHSYEIEGAIVLPDCRILSWTQMHDSLDEGNHERTLRIWDSQSGKCHTILEGHPHHVSGAFGLPNGRLLSWSSYDKTLRVWDSRSGKCLALLEGLSGPVAGVLVLPDGRVVAWSNYAKTLYIWDSQSGECLAAFEGHLEAVDRALVLPNGHILSWSYDKTLRVWDSQSGKCLAVLEGHSETIKGALVLPDGRIVTWTRSALFLFRRPGDKTLRIWDSQTGKCLAVLEGHSETIQGALVLPDGHILSWSLDHILRIWDNQSGKCLAVLDGHSGMVEGAIVLPDGRIFSWASDKTLRIWDGFTGKCLAVLEGHSAPINGVLVLPNGHLLSWASDKTLRIWDDQSGICLSVLKGHSASVNGVLVLLNGRILSWAGGYESKDHTLRIWDCITGKSIAVLEGHSTPAKGALELPNDRILSWAKDKTLRIWDSQVEKSPAVLKPYSFNATGTMVLPDGRILSWTGGYKSKDHILRIWDSQLEKCIAILKGHSGWVKGTLILPDDRILSWSSDMTLRIWDSQTDKCLVVLEGHSGIVGAIVLSDGRILSWALDNTLRIWDRQTGKCLAVLEGHLREVSGALGLPNGHILSWALDNTLRIWDSQTGKCLTVLEGHSASVDGALVLPDGRILSWAGGWENKDNTLRIWDNQTGKCLAVLEGHSDHFRSVLVLPDGHILSWAWNAMRIWDSQGKSIAVHSIDDGLRLFPYLQPTHFAYDNKDCIQSSCLWKQKGDVGVLQLFGENFTTSFQWHGDSECRARYLSPDGRAILTQKNGHGCFLQLHHGNRPISIKELEEMYGLTGTSIISLKK